MNFKFAKQAAIIIKIKESICFVTSRVLDGRMCAKRMEAELCTRLDAIKSGTGITPNLATVLVGDDPASQTYVQMKQKACARIGMGTVHTHLPAATSTEELLSVMQRLNEDEQVFGILLQHPVPDHIDEKACFDAISIEKDVDGVTCLGFGRMSMQRPAYGSATATGIMTLLAHYEIPISGKHAIVAGRSPILGKPVAMMLLNSDATVTVCHSKTQYLHELIGTADILVGAVGIPHFIRGDWIKDGAVVIDAGYHPGGLGDISLEASKERLSAYTPVPGGVGPMTIVTLVAQTVEAAEKKLYRS